MGDTWLTDLGAVLRRAGLTVVEQAGWQGRARGSGGYDDDRPWCVMWHHTASSPSSTAAGDADYMSFGADAAPIANLLVARDGAVWVLAAGATNTNGSGEGRIVTSRGTVPADEMNTHAIGMELQNSGVGETYPQAQVDAAFTASLAVCAAYGLEPTDVGTHQVYAADRKIDPATAVAVAGFWQPAPVTSSGSWSLPDLAAEAAHRAGAGPAPPDPAPPDPTPEATVNPFLIQSPTTIAVVYGAGQVVALDGDSLGFADAYPVFAVSQAVFDAMAAGGG